MRPVSSPLAYSLYRPCRLYRPSDDYRRAGVMWRSLVALSRLVTRASLWGPPAGATCRALWACVCVFFPFILDIKFDGRTSRGHTGGRSHRISHPTSFCGACLNFTREKNSAIPFPRRILCTNSTCWAYIYIYILVRKNHVCRDSNSRPNQYIRFSNFCPYMVINVTTPFSFLVLGSLHGD